MCGLGVLRVFFFENDRVVWCKLNKAYINKENIYFFNELIFFIFYIFICQMKSKNKTQEKEIQRGLFPLQVLHTEWCWALWFPYQSERLAISYLVYNFVYLIINSEAAFSLLIENHSWHNNLSSVRFFNSTSALVIFAQNWLFEIIIIYNHGAEMQWTNFECYSQAPIRFQSMNLLYKFRTTCTFSQLGLYCGLLGKR